MINLDQEDVDNEESSKRSAHSKHDSGRADLERVTDYVEEKELTTQQLTQVITDLLVDNKAQQDVRNDSSKLRKEDVELIVNEMEVTRAVAERQLKKHGGNLKLTLKSMLNSYCS